NIEFREMDAEEPGLLADSVDAALCRWALMFLPHLAVALTRLRELLVPRGRFAAAVWANPEKVPFTSVPMGAIRRVLHIAPPPAGTPGTFSLADDEVLQRAFTQAGFTAVAIDLHSFLLKSGPLDKSIENPPATSASIRAMLADASPAQLEAIWQIVSEEIGTYQQPSGALRIPNET